MSCDSFQPPNSQKKTQSTSQRPKTKNVTQVNGDPIIEETYRRGLVCFIRFFKGIIDAPICEEKTLQGPRFGAFCGFCFFASSRHTTHAREKTQKKHGMMYMFAVLLPSEGPKALK